MILVIPSTALIVTLLTSQIQLIIIIMYYISKSPFKRHTWIKEEVINSQMTCDMLLSNYYEQMRALRG